MAKGDFNPQRGDTYPGTPRQDAARWLQRAARDYLKERVTEAAVTEAVKNWLCVVGGAENG